MFDYANNLHHVHVYYAVDKLMTFGNLGRIRDFSVN